MRVRRYLFVFLGLFLVVGVLAAIKGAQIATVLAFAKRAQRVGPPPETVATAVAQEEQWDETLESVGTVAVVRGVTINNDAPGIVRRIAFDSGATVERGQVLVDLDTRVERAQLQSARARRALAQVTALRTRALAARGMVPASQSDTDESALAGASADADSLAAQIDRKTVRAPFAGRLGIRLVNVGQYLQPGTPITTLESEKSTYVDFSMPQKNVPVMRPGMAVRIGVDAGGPGFEGTIVAVDPTVDAITRNVKVRARVPERSERLRPGMFVRVSAVLPQKARVIVVPATAIVHAPFGDSLFIVEDEPGVVGPDGKPQKLVRQQFVRLGLARGDFVAVKEGVEPAQEVVTAGGFKLRNRMRVVVNNEVRLRPDLAPRPPNR